jgi:hypothetical protein
MCQFASFLYNKTTGEIRVHDLCSHSKTEEHFGGQHNDWREGHYLPDNRIECLVSDTDKESSEYYESILRLKWLDFASFINWAIKEASPNGEYGGYLDLRGCDLSKITALPQSVGGSLNLRGCDIKKIILWPKSVGGPIYMYKSDLYTLTIPEHIKEKLSLRSKQKD